MISSVLRLLHWHAAKDFYRSSCRKDQKALCSCRKPPRQLSTIFWYCICDSYNMRFNEVYCVSIVKSPQISGRCSEWPNYMASNSEAFWEWRISIGWRDVENGGLRLWQRQIACRYMSKSSLISRNFGKIFKTSVLHDRRVWWDFQGSWAVESIPIAHPHFQKRALAYISFPHNSLLSTSYSTQHRKVATRNACQFSMQMIVDLVVRWDRPGPLWSDTQAIF